MTNERKRALGIYAGGMGSLLAGAWLTEHTASMVPLALGASALLMCTATVVKLLLTRQAVR